MTDRSKSFTLGFVAATVLFTSGAFVASNVREAAIRSKSKHLLGQAHYLDEIILAYRDSHADYPHTKADVVAAAQKAGYRETDFDYFVSNGRYTLIYPSLTGKLRWEPYVFQDGRLSAYPVYMEPEMAQLHLQRGSALPRIAIPRVPHV